MRLAVGTLGLGLLAMVGWGCAEQPDSPSRGANATVNPTTAAPEDCPGPALLEAVHAAAFQFQHGPVDRAESHLERARELATNVTDTTTQRALSKLTEIATRKAGEPEWAHLETERLRLLLSDWSCLTEELHQRFHAELPPIP